MQPILQVLWEYCVKTSASELAAVVLALGYVVLAIKRSLWCWLCAFVSTAIYVALMFQARLYMETALQLFYLAMAVYGYIAWRRGSSAGEVTLTHLSLRVHGLVLLGIAAIGCVNGFILSRTTNAAWPYVDALITWSSVATTWMVTRRVIENWVYWIAIDAVSAYIYFRQDLKATGVLFVLYTFIAMYGCYVWLRDSRAAPKTAALTA